MGIVILAKVRKLKSALTEIPGSENNFIPRKGY